MSDLIEITREQIAERAGDHPADYLETLENAAVKSTETALWFEPRDWMAILAKYNARGYGTRIYRLVNPAARRLDSIFGTNLSNCSGCARRMARWNA